MIFLLSTTLFASLAVQVVSIPQPHRGPPPPFWPEDQLSVHTASGLINGIIDPDLPHVRQFLGVPYAQPPLGDLRFSPPQHLAQSASLDTVNATVLPPACPQYLTDSGASVYTHDVLEFNLQGLNTTGAISEDCLTLSVWAPTLPAYAPPLPVIVFFPGGGFTTGGTNVPYQIPTQWVERSKNVIVVTINYRLNIFGFANAAGLTTQNAGVLDQRASVEWVSANIAAFGGDPSRITIWGQSAGAISVDYYSFAYPDDPIAVAQVQDSGTALSPILSADYSHSNFSYVASRLGCPTTSASEELSCMRSLPFRTIESFLASYADNDTTPALDFVPIPDNASIFDNYTARALAGLWADIPAIIGTNAQDGVPFAPYPLSDPNAGPNQTLVLEELLTIFFCPSTETVRLRNMLGRQTFRYEYAGNFSNISPRWWEGAYHSSEQPLIMGTFDNYRGVGPVFENETSVVMQDAWEAFMWGGAQGLEATGWEMYKDGGNSVRWFGDNGVPVRNGDLSALEGLCDGASPAS